MSKVDRIEEALVRLGIDPQRLELVALLPLVLVAWADGVVQPAERDLVLGLADRNGLLSAETRPMVEQWLTEEPSPWFMDTSLFVIHALASRVPFPQGLPRDALVAWCWSLASAAGGLFGSSFLAIDARERLALDRIAEALQVNAVPDNWRELSL